MSYNLPILVADGGISPALDTQTLMMIAGGSITAGDVVALDTTQTGANRAQVVVQAAGVATDGNALSIGFAQRSASSGETFPVVVGGYYASANVNGAAVAGTPLCGPIGTNGQAGVASASTVAPVLAVALAADVSNVAPVFVFRRLV